MTKEKAIELCERLREFEPRISRLPRYSVSIQPAAMDHGEIRKILTVAEEYNCKMTLVDHEYYPHEILIVS